MKGRRKRILSILGLVFVISIGIIAKSGTVKKDEIKAISAKNQEEAAAVKVAENFVNGYITVTNDDFGNWYYNQPISKKFESEYDNMILFLDLQEAILSGEKEQGELTKDQKDLMKRYDIEYDPVFGAGIMDMTESNFKVTSYNVKTGNMILRDINKKVDINFPARVIKENGKWVVDGAGGVNMSK